MVSIGKNQTEYPYNIFPFNGVKLPLFCGLLLTSSLFCFYLLLDVHIAWFNKVVYK